jgi:hypothetical protein
MDEVHIVDVTSVHIKQSIDGQGNPSRFHHKTRGATRGTSGRKLIHSKPLCLVPDISERQELHIFL